MHACIRVASNLKKFCFRSNLLNLISQIYQLNKGEFDITKVSLKDMIDLREKEKALCEHELEIINKAIQESLQPQTVWLQEKEIVETKIKEIDKRLDILNKILEHM